MPAFPLHPLDARFLKLALVQQLLSPSQVKQAEESLQRRLKRGQPVTIEQILQEDGYLTDAECQSLWDLIAQAADTHAREQISERRESAPLASAESIPGDIGHLPDISEAYHILGLIGRGGMGTVFRARQLHMDREVALKVLRSDLAVNARYIRRFIREARAAGQLDHPNLVRVYDVGEAGSGGWFMAMEYVEGRTVRHLLRREGRLSLLDSLRIIAQVAAALECAHRNKIVHRDIKPDNIMITSRGVAKLCDLGLAKALDGPLQDTDTQEGSTLGTPHYMSPEQAQGQPLDERSDLFSLGATLYHMVTGRVPFEGRSALEVMLKVSTQAPIPPEQIEPLLPPPVCRLIRRLMERDPRARFSSASAVRREVEELCRDMASGRIFAYEDRLPSPGTRRASTPQDRYRLVGVAGAALFLALCVILRTSQGSSRVPPVESPRWVTAAALENPLLETKGTQDPSEEREPPLTATVRPLSDRELEVLEERLSRRHEDWPRVQVDLDDWARRRGGISPQEQVRFNALRKSLAAAQAADAEADWSRRQPVVRAFIHAAQFTVARAILDDVPTPLQHALKERLAEAVESLERETSVWTEESRARFDALQRMGHLRLAGTMLEAWRDLLTHDGAPANDPRRVALADAVDLFRKVAAVRAEQEKTAADARAQLQRTLVQIRLASKKHDLPAAIALCEKALTQAAGQGETVTLKAERERLARVQRLFHEMADALARNPRVIGEKTFRPNEATPGLVTGMDERHLIVVVPNSGRPNDEARIPLSTITRTEMQALIDQVFTVKKFADDDPIGRVAYDAEDSGAEVRALLYEKLGNSNPLDRDWLKWILQSEQRERHRFAAQWIDEAEQQYLKNRGVEALQVLAAAREALGSEPGAQGAAGTEGLAGRIRDLLALVAADETRSHLLKGTCFMLLSPRARVDAAAVEFAVWPWKPVAPREGNGGLTFAEGAAEADSGWLLRGRTRLEWDVSLPTTGLGTFAVTLAAGGRSWVVRLSADGDRATVSLEVVGAPAPDWATSQLPGGIGRVRLWLETDREELRWGVDDRTLGTYLTELQGEWQLRLSGRGNVVLNGLRIQGAVETTVPPDNQPGQARLRSALGKPAGRMRGLRGILTSPLLTLPQRALCYAAIADENRTIGLSGEAQGWDALALYACPWDQLPDEVRAREDDHRKRQEQCEHQGGLPVDLRKL